MAKILLSYKLLQKITESLEFFQFVGNYYFGNAITERTMIESAVTSKGQTTLPKAVREALGIKPGDRVRYAIIDSNEVRLVPVRPLSRLFGILQHSGPPVTLEEMERAISEGAKSG